MNVSMNVSFPSVCRRICFISWVALVGVGFSTSLSFAQEEGDAETDQAEKHFIEGKKLYDEGKFAEAIEQLLEAYKLRPAPPILLNVARTYEKLDDKPKALEFYRLFLQKARLVDPNRGPVEALVKELEKATGDSKAGSDDSLSVPAVQQETGDESGIDATASETEPSVSNAALIHTPVDQAHVDRPITIQAELPPRAEAGSVWLNFRKIGDPSFRRIEMSPQGDAFVGQIPATYVTSSSLQYFLEAFSGDGKNAKDHAIARSGSKTNPHIVVIEGGQRPMSAAETEAAKHSPWRKWFWTAASSTVALIGAAILTGFLASDRASAMKEWANQSCNEACQANTASRPTKFFDDRAQAWESEGKLYGTLSTVFISTSIVAAGVTAYLWYVDREYLKEKQHVTANAFDLRRRIALTPWIAPIGGGIESSFSF